jgi:alanine racemase
MGSSVTHIYHKNFHYNINLISDAVKSSKIMAVVKANAYGHGSIELSKTALKAGCEYLGVAFVEEGIELRENDISSPILVFGAHDASFLVKATEYNLDITLTSFEQIKSLKKANRKCNVHLKVDTGMNRVGFKIVDYEKALKLVLDSNQFKLKGIYSHFATSDAEDASFANLQITRFNEIRKISEKYIQHEVLFHMANSGAIMNFPKAHYDMVRPGVMLYGGLPNPQFKTNWNLKPVMQLRSKISLTKFLQKGESVSYGRKYFAPDNTNIGIIPIGYADGYNRLLTNKGEVLIHNKKYPVVGTVCMDMIMIDIQNESKLKTGDDVILFGQEGNEGISIDEIALRTGTIAYEITCNISKRIPRIHIYNS